MVTPLSSLEAIAAPLMVANIDTGQIFPSRFLRKKPSHGLGRYLFHDLRYDAEGRPRPDFILNRAPYRDSRILVSGANFGCGSAREAAVAALVESGFRCIIAPSFGDIFYITCLRSGLLPIRLPEEDVRQLATELIEQPVSPIAVHLDEQYLVHPNGRRVPFDIDPSRKKRLQLGLDDCSLAMAKIDKIECFEQQYARAVPWLQLGD